MVNSELAACGTSGGFFLPLLMPFACGLWQMASVICKFFELGLRCLCPGVDSGGYKEILDVYIIIYDICTI